jgi:hypothetical protein
MLMKSDVLEFLIAKGPGRTELELARAIYGDGGYQQSVNQDCEALARMGKAERRGGGIQGNPYRYYSA